MTNVPRTIWTIQPRLVWTRLLAQRSLCVDRRHYSREQGRAFVPEAYLWLARQMHLRLPGGSRRIPWWGYCEMPDLRTFRHLRVGEQVRIELRLEPGSFLSFPSWAWDTVYGKEFLSATRAEWRRWRERLQRAGVEPDTWPLPQPFQAEIEASWQLLFDLPVASRGWRGPFSWRAADETAVFEKLRLDEVVAVTEFSGALVRSRSRAR